MNKKTLSERDICTRYITPALEKSGWDKQLQILEEVSFTDGKIYVLEANNTNYFCCLDQKYKSGPALLDFYDRITNINAYRVHIIKTNIHKFIDMNKFIESMYKYKDYKFSFFNGENNIYCVSYISKLLPALLILLQHFFHEIVSDMIS